LIATGLLILFLNTGINGAEELRVAGEPLLDGFRLMVGDQLAALLGLIALIGLLASLQGIMFAYARNMFSLSRAGYYPRGLSVTNNKNVPFVALVVGAVIGFAALLSIEVLTAVDAEGAGAVAGAIVLNIAVWGAMLAYMMQAVSFLILRRKLPNLKRPYMSPWGVPGAVAAAVIAGISFVGYLINPAFQTAIAGIAVIYLIMLIIFAVYGRHNLVLAPEEEYAVTNSKK
jgi:ethanolamine permease